MLFTHVPWIEILSFPSNNSVSIAEISYDIKTSLLKVKVNYNESVHNKALNMTLNKTDPNSPFVNISKTDWLFSAASANGLPLFVYSEFEYSLSKYLKIFASIISALSLVNFLVGFFGPKLIALENIAVFQLTWLCLNTIKQPSITFDSLNGLKFSFGYNRLKEYDYGQQSLPENIRFQ